MQSCQLSPSQALLKNLSPSTTTPLFWKVWLRPLSFVIVWAQVIIEYIFLHSLIFVQLCFRRKLDYMSHIFCHKSSACHKAALKFKIGQKKKFLLYKSILHPVFRIQKKSVFFSFRKFSLSKKFLKLLLSICLHSKTGLKLVWRYFW